MQKQVLKKGKQSVKKIRRLISFDSQIYAELKHMAAEEERPFSWEVRRAIEAYLTGRGQKIRMSDTKQKLMAEGVSKEIVNLVGTVPQTSLKEEKYAVARAVQSWFDKKRVAV